MPEAAFCIELSKITCGNHNLKSIELPAGLESIRDGAFRNCASLTSLKLPASLTTIERDAFNGCSSLTSLTIFSDLGEPQVLKSGGHLTPMRCGSLSRTRKRGELKDGGLAVRDSEPDTLMLNAFGQWDLTVDRSHGF